MWPYQVLFVWLIDRALFVWPIDRCYHSGPEQWQWRGTPLSDGLMSYLGHSLRRSYPSAKIQAVYVSASDDWAGLPGQILKIFSNMKVIAIPVIVGILEYFPRTWKIFWMNKWIEEWLRRLRLLIARLKTARTEFLTAGPLGHEVLSAGQLGHEVLSAGPLGHEVLSAGPQLPYMIF